MWELMQMESANWLFLAGGSVLYALGKKTLRLARQHICEAACPGGHVLRQMYTMGTKIGNKAPEFTSQSLR